MAWATIIVFVKKRVRNNVGNDRTNGVKSIVDLYCTRRLSIGLAFSTYFKGTRIGLWLYSKFDRSVDYLVERFGWTWLEQPEDAWRKKYPYVTKKIDELEKRLENLEEKV